MKALFIIILIMFSSISEAQIIEENNSKNKENFDKIANYLSASGGKWTGKNKFYNPDNPRSAKAFGLWFDRPLKNLLSLKIVAYLQDTIIISSQGSFSWHPKKKEYIHTTADRGSGFSEGITTFPNDSTFVSTMINYRPNGKEFDHKDENFIISENLHENISFKKDDQGNWIENGRWTWTRDPLE